MKPHIQAFEKLLAENNQIDKLRCFEAGIKYNAELEKPEYLKSGTLCWVYTGKEWEIATLLAWSTSTYDGNTLPVAIICLDRTKRVTHVAVDLVSFSNRNPGRS